MPSRHAYQLYELRCVYVDAMTDAYDVMHAIFAIPDTISSHLKFLPILLAVIFTVKIVRRDADE